MTGREPDPSVLRAESDATFDDEGAGTVAPELVDAYRAFSMAVRNEERAFSFWIYVAAQSPSPELRAAAEQMAREELDHVARLRRERRRAFHQATAGHCPRSRTGSRRFSTRRRATRPIRGAPGASKGWRRRRGCGRARSPMPPSARRGC
jgi:hypothetical protein